MTRVEGAMETLTGTAEVRETTSTPRWLANRAEAETTRATGAA